MKDKKIFAFLTIALGLWQLAFPLTFSHFCPDCFQMTISDIAMGAAIIVFGILSSISLYPLASAWLVGLTGLWLQLSPLIFWSHFPLSYLNDTLVGAIAIVFAFQLAKGPAKSSSTNDCPKGWSYNPSSWKHRIPTVGLAMICWFLARYMATYQLGYITQIWDPFFSDGTLKVITSNISKSFPISDAGLGALFYTLEALLGWQGDHRRWATMPWLVFSFAFLIIPVGIVSIVLIILQPVDVGTWCSWCLATALCMLTMIVLTAGEFAATLQFLNESVRNGESFWRTFWKGERQSADIKTKPLVKQSDGWGISFHPNLIIGAIAGIVLLFLPAFFHYQDRLAMSDYIVGPILFAISVVSMAEVFFTLRYGLVATGIWLLIAPWILAENPVGFAIILHLLIGIWLILSVVLWKAKIRESYGTWESLII